MKQSREIPGEARRTEKAHCPETVPWHSYAAELAGTFFMVAWGLSAVVFMMSASSPMNSLVPAYRVRLLLTGILFAAGAWVAFLVFAEAPVTGTSLNPARSLGPAVVMDDYRDLWVYFLGPLGGAAAVALLWRPAIAAGMRSVFCAKLFHTDRYRCHLADCRFAGSHPSVGVASRKEDLP